jgi:hypothetical protein
VACYHRPGAERYGAASPTIVDGRLHTVLVDGTGTMRKFQKAVREV